MRDPSMRVVKITYKNGGEHRTSAGMIDADMFSGDNIPTVWPLPKGSFAQVISQLMRIFLFIQSLLSIAIIEAITVNCCDYCAE
jgi:hypothetical protein